MLRQFSCFYSQSGLPEHMPELLIKQDISRLLNFNKNAQVFDVRGKEKPDYVNGLSLKRVK